MSREEAAAKAQYEAVTGKPWEKATGRAAKLCREDSVAIIKAADAHDQANGIHRVTLDELTKAIYDVDPLNFMGDVEPTPWEKLGPAWRALARSKAEAVIARIAALRKGSGE